MSDILLIIGGVIAGVYLLIGFAHASAIQSDKTVGTSDFLFLMLCWPFSGRSWL